MSAWFFDFKFQYPWRYKSLIAALIFGSIFIVLMMVPESTFTRAIGIIHLQQRAVALKHALYWDIRVYTNPNVSVKHTVKYGFVDGLTKDSLLAVSIPQGDIYVKEEYRLADVQIKNAIAVSYHVKAYRAVNARFDIYDDMVVVYLDGVPLNLQIIENGMATPDPNPPSNIVDAAFATHYWGIVRGKFN